jgi:TorA maturation chaperone TorD
VSAGLDRFGLAFRCLGWAWHQPPGPDNTRALLAFDDLGGWVLEAADPDTRRGLEQLRACRAQWGGHSLAELEADFNRLFVGPGPLLAPPWESAQRGVDHLLFDQHTLAVRACYARFGLEAPNRGREPDDHLGLELAFLAQLCDRAATLALAGFLEQHLLRWAPRCLGQVLAGARTLYYQGLAHLTLGCLDGAGRAFPPAPGAS